jgi:hypothetical protein
MKPIFWKDAENLLVILEKTRWKIKGADGAAELPGVKPTTLLTRIKKMGLKPLRCLSCFPG